LGKPKPPPAPDYSGIAAASSEAAKYSFELGKQQLAWAKEQYANDSAITNRVVDAALQTNDQNNANAGADRKRYEEIYQPLEGQLAHEAEDYASPQRQEFEAGRAATNVSQQFQQARDAAQQRLESFGIDPSQTRAAALDISTRTQEAAARASASNQARLNAEATGRALRSEAINVGRGYPGQIAQSYNTALQAGNSAVNSGLATTMTGAQTMGTGTQWQQLGNQSLGTWTNALNTQFNNQMDRYKAQQQSSSGIGGILGGIMGIGLKAATGGLFAEGGAVPDPEEYGEGIPDPDASMEAREHAGMLIPRSASPSGGAIQDDVPARVQPGEFILPKDVVQWKGQEFFQKLIDQSRKQQDAATAQPEMAALPDEQPAVSTAIPE
jgi:hypothetical protein